jgi:hypothetical protein
MTFCLGLCAGILGSCIGIGSEIAIRRDGSGTIKLEYRLSRELESLGKLDGNERWLPVPVGKADFERTAARVPGLTLKSFNSSVQGNDIINRITLDFTGTDALIRFLDATGRGVSLTRENGQNRLSLQITDGGRIEPELGELAGRVSEGYFLNLSFSLPSQGELILTDETGRPLPIPQGWKILNPGREPSFSAPIGDILLFNDPARLEIRWGF